VGGASRAAVAIGVTAMTETTLWYSTYYRGGYDSSPLSCVISDEGELRLTGTYWFFEWLGTEDGEGPVLIRAYDSSMERIDITRNRPPGRT
jgi:hypothetical protein